MRFIGQHHIMRQLHFILPDLYTNTDKGANILLKGPSGFGKTRMAHDICRYLSNDSYQVFLAESVPFAFHKRVIFIDEIHKVQNLERFYHMMDEKNHVLVFASNHDGELEEAFVNRCYEFIFDDYTEEELILIARESCGFSATDEQFLDIVKAGNNNPRIINSLCNRISLYLNQNNTNTHQLNFSELISNVFRIDDGLDTLSRRYIETLRKVGGRCSLSLITTILHVDKNSIVNTVEPTLVKKGIIQITSKGRILCQ